MSYQTILRYLYASFFMLLSAYPVYAQNADIEMLRRINLERNKSLDGSMKLITHTEAYIGLAAPFGTCLAAYIRHDKELLQKGINMTLALGMASLKTYVIKRIVDRPRPATTYPEIEALVYEKRYSFPSGHTSNAFCTATSLSLNFRKWYVVLPSFAWAGAVAYSRMHLGVHYPSDVAAGALLGAGSAFATYQVNRFLKRKFEQKFTGSK